jgi:hypothetical protein
MKPITLLFAVSLAFIASGARAQGQGDACSNQYGSCMNHCSSRPQSLQESCSQMCEANTNHCYEGVYGSAPQDGQAAGTVSTPEPEARAARDEAKAPETLNAKRK